MKIAIFFFSGTGNTYYVSTLMKEVLSCFATCDLYAIEGLQTDSNTIINQYDMIGLGFPVYGSSLPDLVFSWIDQLDRHHKNAFVFCTQMMYSGDGAAYAGRLLKKKGFRITMQEHFNMPNNIVDIPIFKRIKPYSHERIHQYVMKKVHKCQYYIQNNIPYRKGSNPISLLLGLLQRVPYEAYEKRVISRVVKIDASLCVKCGECVDLCPVQNFKLEANGITQVGTCITCYRCINHCPQQAITLLGRKMHSTPYHGPTSHFDIKQVQHHCISNISKE
jgi:ferredoxin/flavodoxin